MHKIPDFHRSVYGTGATLIFGHITKMTSNDIAAFATIVAGTATAIYTILKIVDWFENRANKKRWKSKHKTP